MSKPTLFLVDGSSYLYRAFHALPPLASSTGEPTGAIYGVTNMVRRIQSEDAPDRIAIVFDAPGKTFRHEAYPDYKATRPPMAEELRCQIAPLKELLGALGLPLITEAGVEADDVIATLTERALRAGHKVVISSSDKDLAQLVNADVTLVNTMTNARLDPAGVKKKFGVDPTQIVDYLTLIGDSSDNIPGVDLVGPKKAAKWLSEYVTLEEVLAHAEDVGGKTGQNLRDMAERLPETRKLIRLKADLDLDLELDALRPAPADAEQLAELYRRFDFRAWLEELDSSEPAQTREVGLEVHILREPAKLQAFVEQAAQKSWLALDVETDSTDPQRAALVGISLCSEQGLAAYLPLGHESGDEPQIELSTALAAMAPLLEPSGPKIVGQHFKFDLTVLQRHGIDVPNFAEDTMLASYVLESTAARHDLDSLARRYLRRETQTYEQLAGRGAKQTPFPQIPVADAAYYAAEDADVTFCLREPLLEKLGAIPELEAVYRKIELPLTRVLAKMEQTGVVVDAEELARQSEEFGARMLEAEHQAFELAGEEFNLGSTKQLQKILFEKLELPVVRKTPKGQPSTAEDVLEQLAHRYELPQRILDYRMLFKLKNTYTDRLPEQIDQQTGRVHTSYHQAVTATGRLSSSDPNLQNIPIRTEEGRRIRRAFVPRDGWKMLAADYSQIELRIMAHISGDQALTEAFNTGQDIHRRTASEVFADGKEATDEQRRAAKTINFGLIYGMSAWGLARQLDISRTEAQEYIDRYFEQYPGVAEYIEDTRKVAKRRGYVETLFHRRLHLPEINSRNPARRGAAERAAINAPMQGTAADIIKRAMIEVDAIIDTRYAGQAAMLLQVHDELVFEFEPTIEKPFVEEICTIMCAAAELTVPLEVEAGVGSNWHEAH